MGGGDETVQLTGFVCVGDGADATVALRPHHPLDAPELLGRSRATAADLCAADMWACGVLLNVCAKAGNHVRAEQLHANDP